MFVTFNVSNAGVQWQEGQGRHNSPGAESLQGMKKVPTLSQVPSSIQYIASERPQAQP